jgi:subtilisin family serine protease
MSLLAATAIVTALVGLPAGATAPPPGSLPPRAQVQVLDRQLGFVAVRLPRRGSQQALARLRAATGVRYVIRPALTGGIAAEPCRFTAGALTSSSKTWRSTIRLSSHSAAGFTVGIPDTGADLGRLGGVRDRLVSENFVNGSNGVIDEVGHGTQVASLIGAHRTDLGISGVAPDVGLAIARIESPTQCSAGEIAANLIQAFRWFRQIGDVQIVNVSANLVPSRMLVESLQALQQSGTLVVAAMGNKVNPGRATFPAIEPHVIGVGALDSNSKTRVYASSGHGTDVDLVAPGGGAGVIVSGNSNVSPDAQTGVTVTATSYATPIVTGAAALVWAKHPDWDASRVASALELSAVHISGGRPNRTSGWGRLDVKAALHEIPPADLDEPNDWPSAVRGLPSLATGTTYPATVGGQNDPLDAYPLDTTRRGSVQISGNGDLRAWLLPAGALDSLNRPTVVLSARSVSRGEGGSLRLRIPRKGSWIVVVNVRGVTHPLGYTLRAS